MIVVLVRRKDIVKYPVVVTLKRSYVYITKQL